VRHHDVERIARRLIHHPGRLFLDHHPRLRQLVTGIEPREAARQPLQDARHLGADMARAVEHDVELRWLRAAVRHAPESKGDAAAATLAKRIAERESVLAKLP